MSIIKEVKDGVEIVGQVLGKAGDDSNAKAAAGELGKSALTITKTINNALLPLAALNYGIEKARKYFNEKFAIDLSEKTSAIPPENIVEPKSSIAGPALQGLAFSYEEPNLKEMYLNLLASAMDGRIAENVHPAFVQVIQQLTSEEAQLLLNYLCDGMGTPIAEIRLKDTRNGAWNTMHRHLLDVRDKSTNMAIANPRIPAMVDNWIRLGLVTVEYGKFLTATEIYDWVKQRPEYLNITIDNSNLSSMQLTYEKGVMGRSSFGVQFARAVGVLK